MVMFFIAIKNLYKKDKNRQFSLDLKSKIFSWKNGFLPESAIIYDFKENSPINYLSDLTRATKTNKINKENSIIIDNKLLFAINFKNDKIVLPLFYLNENSILDLKKRKKIEIRDLTDYLSQGSEYVIKPEGGGGGYGIYFLRNTNSVWYLNDEKKEEHQIIKLLNQLNKTLIYNRIRQTGIASNIFPNSLNTIRLLTMIDPVSKNPFIASAVFRCGTSKTNGVDNWSSGGLSSNIDIESGIMSKAVAFPNKGKLEWMQNHPDTGFKIEGFKIHNWKTIKKEILSLSKKHFYIPYIGWDIISTKGNYLILEANSNSDVNLLQVHKPLFINDKVKRFYKHHNVI